jgi:hypothetical protein
MRSAPRFELAARDRWVQCTGLRRVVALSATNFGGVQIDLGGGGSNDTNTSKTAEEQAIMGHWCKRSTLLAAISLCVSLAPALSVARPTAVFSQAAGPTGKVALVGGSVVNVEDGSVIADAVVLIEGDRIKAVGPASSVSVPADARKIRMDGKWLAPGLLNMHTHFGLKLPGPAGAALANETDMQLVLRMADK